MFEVVEVVLEIDRGIFDRAATTVVNLRPSSESRFYSQPSAIERNLQSRGFSKLLNINLG